MNEAMRVRQHRVEDEQASLRHTGLGAQAHYRRFQIESRNTARQPRLMELARRSASADLVKIFAVAVEHACQRFPDLLTLPRGPEAVGNQSDQTSSDGI